MEKDNEEKKLEGWNKLLKEKCKIPERFELINKDKPKEKSYKKYFLIFLGLAIIGSAIFYGFYYDKININVFNNETLICTCDCDNEPCPDCNVEVICGNFTIPNNLNIVVNETE